jgi:hypothetical protein
MTLRNSGLTRRSLLKTSAATGAALATTAGVNMFNINPAFAQMKNPADVLATLNVGKFVKKE